MSLTSGSAEDRLASTGGTNAIDPGVHNAGGVHGSGAGRPDVDS